MRYTVTMVYQYTHTVEVEAESEKEAINSAVDLVDDNNRNYDDSWHDASAVELSEE